MILSPKKDGFLYPFANLVKLTDSERIRFVEQIEQRTGAVVIDRKNLSETFFG